MGRPSHATFEVMKLKIMIKEHSFTGVLGIGTTLGCEIIGATLLQWWLSHWLASYVGCRQLGQGANALVLLETRTFPQHAK